MKKGDLVGYKAYKKRRWVKKRYRVCMCGLEMEVGTMMTLCEPLLLFWRTQVNLCGTRKKITSMRLGWVRPVVEMLRLPLPCFLLCGFQSERQYPHFLVSISLSIVQYCQNGWKMNPTKLHRIQLKIWQDKPHRVVASMAWLIKGRSVSSIYPWREKRVVDSLRL